MMPQKNAVWAGLLLGLILPVVAYAVLLMLFEQLDALGILSRPSATPRFRERTLSIVAIALNVFVLNYYSKRRFFLQTVRGIVIATFIGIAAWAAIFWKYIF